jgi:diguanylate cyclase (GGDEF)-like protein
MSAALKVLQVEDDPLDARLLKDMLASEGQGQVQVTHVEYLSDAKQCVKDRHYDVALLDLMLPDEKGVATIEGLRADAPDLPIVVYTGLPGLSVARDAIRAGADDYAVKGHTDAFTLVRKLSMAIERHQLKRALYGQLTALSAENQQLMDLSFHDPLTGLYNRRGLEERLRSYLEPGQPDSYATLIDVDDFRDINDRLGHHVGDQVLQEVAQSMLACSQGQTVLARIGGDEFLAVGHGGRAEAEAHGHCLRRALSVNAGIQHLLPGRRLTCCQAITLLKRRRLDLAEILEHTRAALAHGKISGKDQVIGQWSLSGDDAAPR